MVYNRASTIERLKQYVHEKKPVILITGVAGTGKTTTTNELLHDLRFDHRLGTGWIRQILRSISTKEQFPALFSYSFRPEAGCSPFEHYLKASKALVRSVEDCADRALREGQSLIIEGPMIIPGMISREKYNLLICLEKSPDEDVYYRMLTTDTHTKREIFTKDLQNNSIIQSELFTRCNQYDVPIIPFRDEGPRYDLVLQTLERRLLFENG